MIAALGAGAKKQDRIKRVASSPRMVDGRSQRRGTQKRRRLKVGCHPSKQSPGHKALRFVAGVSSQDLGPFGLRAGGSRRFTRRSIWSGRRCISSTFDGGMAWDGMDGPPAVFKRKQACVVASIRCRAMAETRQDSVSLCDTTTCGLMLARANETSRRTVGAQGPAHGPCLKSDHGPLHSWSPVS